MPGAAPRGRGPFPTIQCRPRVDFPWASALPPASEEDTNLPACPAMQGACPGRKHFWILPETSEEAHQYFQRPPELTHTNPEAYGRKEPQEISWSHHCTDQGPLEVVVLTLPAQPLGRSTAPQGMGLVGKFSIAAVLQQQIRTQPSKTSWGKWLLLVENSDFLFRIKEPPKTQNSSVQKCYSGASWEL